MFSQRKFSPVQWLAQHMQIPRVSAYAAVLLGAAIILLNAATLLHSTPTELRTSRSAANTAPPREAPLPLAEITALNVFGKVAVDPVVDVANLPTTKQNWKLVGIIGSSLTGDSRSLISIDGNPAKAYFKGDALPDGATVYDIDTDFVLVQRSEQIEKLPLHAGNPVVSVPTRHTPSNAIVDAPVHVEPMASPAPVTQQNVYKALDDRLAAVLQKKSS